MVTFFGFLLLLVTRALPGCWVGPLASAVNSEAWKSLCTSGTSGLLEPEGGRVGPEKPGDARLPAGRLALWARGGGGRPARFANVTYLRFLGTWL